MQNNKIIIGIVGTQSSGKDTIADYLVKKYDFSNISTGDMVRDYIRENNLGAPERDLMQKVANQMRIDNGPDVLARRAIEKPLERIIVSGIRAIAEAKAVKDAGGLLISCDAPIEMRYERIAGRNRVGDEVSFEKFKSQEEFEKKNADPNAQNIDGVMEMADFKIENIGTIEELNNKVENLVKELIT